MPHKKSEEGYLSVTEVLNLSIPKPFLNFWYGKYGTEKCNQIKRESQEIGIEVHKLIEERFKNGEASPGTPRAVQMEVNFWEQFVIPYNVKPIALEKSYKCSKYKIQGTFDAVIDINGERYLADWKTSNSIDKVSVPLQLCAYDYLQREEGLIEKGVCIRIDKETDKVEIKMYQNLKPYWPVFKHCIAVARYNKWGIE